MDMRLTKSMSRRAIVNQWMQSIAINNSREAFQAEASNVADLFGAIQGRLQPGDIVSLSFEPQSGTSFTINQTRFSQGHSKTLFILFLRAWLGPVPPSSEFRDNILGNTAPKPELLQRLEATIPSDTRIAAIAAWAQPPEPESKPEETTIAFELPEPRLSGPPSDGTIKAVASSNTDTSSLPGQEKQPEQKALPVEASLTAGKPVGQPEVEELEPPEPEVSVESLLAQQEYTTNAIQKVYKLLRYPKSAVRRNHQGSVRLQFELNRDGSLKNVEAVEESQYTSLNDAALKAVEKAAPFDRVPEAISDDALIFTVPVAFRLVSE